MNLLSIMTTGKMPWSPRGTCGISLAPETYTEGGGGLLDDVDVQFLALRFRTSEGTPYDKPGSKVAPLLQVDMLPDGTEEVHSQYYSCGDLANIGPSGDGETLVAKTEKGGSINKNCNAAMFLTSLVVAGLESQRLNTERISALAGIKAHVVRTKREKIKGKGAVEGQADPTVLTVSRIISTPWGAPQSTAPIARVFGEQKPHAQVVKELKQEVAKINAQANGNVFDDSALAMLAVEVLAANGNSMSKLKMMFEVNKLAQGGRVPLESKDPEGKPARSTISQRAFGDAFLTSQPFGAMTGPR